MPPKKKGTAKAKAPATTVRSTRASTVVDKRGKEYETTAAAARPRRDSSAGASSLPTVTQAAPKKRGRPAAAPAKRGPGRPPKNAATSTPAKRGPGRPPKKASAATTEKPVAAGRKRGRPSASEQAVPDDEEPPPKRRGRPPKGGETTRVAADDDAAAEQLEEELEDEADEEESLPKRSTKGKARMADTPLAANEEDVSAAGEQQYWLMKAEQDGHDVKLKDGSTFNTTFTIDDLRSKTEPEAWDGVRNPTAAKNMRQMKKGDRAFFYASGGKSGRKPGIVGIMEIVREHELDATTSDESSYGYVEKEKDRGKWCVVHVEFRQKLSKPVYLSELQKFSKEGGALANMQEFKAARLSVSKVSEEEWDFITKNLIDGYDDDDESAAHANRPKIPNGPGPGDSDGIQEATEANANDTAAAEAAVLQTETTVATRKIENGEVVVESSTILKEAELPTIASPPVKVSIETTLSDGFVPPATSDTIAPQAVSSRPASRAASRARSSTPKAAAAAAAARSMTPMDVVAEETAELVPA